MFDFIWNKKFQWWLLTVLHIETLVIIGVIILIIYFAYFGKLEDLNVEKLKADFFGHIGEIKVDKNGSSATKPKKVWKHEERCREIFEEIFDTRFKSVRPDFLKNPVSNKNLELDGFAPNIETKLGKGLAFEYDGVEHSQYNKHFHRSGPEEFLYTCQKDSWKDLKCKEKGILLIRIPHFVAFNDLERFIKNKLRKEGLFI